MNYMMLNKNIVANGVESFVTAFNTGVTKDGRDLTFMYDKLNSGGSGVFTRQEFPHVNLKTLSMDEVFETLTQYYGVDKIACMKVDCEGCEVEIIPAIISNPEWNARIDHTRSEFHPDFPAVAALLPELKQWMGKHP